MRITWSKHSADWIRLCYDLLKITVSLVVLGPIVTQKALNMTYLVVGSAISLALFCFSIYIREKG